jgi:hypothetical protein
VTHIGELRDKIAEQTSKARRSTREVKAPIYFSITVVLLWFIPKGSTKQRSNIAITHWHNGATVPFRSSKRLARGDRGQAANSPTKHQPKSGGIQRPGRSCHLRGYHNYPWGWAQAQVTDSMDTTSTLSITTLAAYDN